MFISKTLVECTSPAQMSDSEAPVAILFDGQTNQTYGSLLNNFSYYANPRVQRIWPLRGPILGGTVVSVLIPLSSPRDMSLLQQLRCRFNQSDVPAVAAPTLPGVHCTTPPQPAGHVTVEITSNDFDWSESGHVFEFHPVRLISVHPSTGPVDGNTHVQVRGADISMATMCAFAGIWVPASMISSTVVACTSPHHAPGEATVRLSLIHSDVTMNSDPIHFHFYTPPL
eukprot:1985561-Prymnesium_polylepis.1